MATFAYLPIAADRSGACVRTIYFSGFDLTSVPLAMQVRLYPDQPGAPLIDLAQVSNDAQGVRLMGVSTVTGVPVSEVRIWISEVTMEDSAAVPYTGEIGQASELSYGLIGIVGGHKRTLAQGPFVALPSTYGSNAAPTDRVVSDPESSRYHSWSTAEVTFSDDNVAVVVEGVNQIAPMVVRADAADVSAQAHAASTDGSEAPALLSVVSRTVLAGFTAVAADRQAQLSEVGRAGVFKWETGNHVAQVSSDPFQGLYVAPSWAPTGASGAWVRQFTGTAYASWFGAIGDATLATGVWRGTDNTARFRSALNLPVVRELVFDGHHMVDTLTDPCLLVPSGKTLRGFGRGVSWLHKKRLPMASTQAQPVSVVECAAAAFDITLSDFSVDVQSSGNGRDLAQRCNAVALAAQRRITVARVDVYNVTGYGHWANGATNTDDDDASVSYEDCYAENCSISFEQTYCQDVRLVGCISVAGPQGSNPSSAVSASSHFHPYGGSRSITFRDCKGIGSAVGVDLSMAQGPISHMVFDNVEIDLGRGSGYTAFSITGGDATNILSHLQVTNCRFISDAGAGASLYFIRDGQIDNSYFFGSSGLTIDNAPLQISNTIARAYTNPAGGSFAFGVVVLGGSAVNWNGGRIEALGKVEVRALPYSGALSVSSSTQLLPAPAAAALKRNEFAGSTNALQVVGSDAYVSVNLPFRISNFAKVNASLTIQGPNNGAYPPAVGFPEVQPGVTANVLIFLLKNGAGLNTGTRGFRAHVIEWA